MCTQSGVTAATGCDAPCGARGANRRRPRRDRRIVDFETGRLKRQGAAWGRYGPVFASARRSRRRAAGRVRAQLPGAPTSGVGETCPHYLCLTLEAGDSRQATLRGSAPRALAAAPPGCTIGSDHAAAEVPGRGRWPRIVDSLRHAEALHHRTFGSGRPSTCSRASFCPSSASIHGRGYDPHRSDADSPSRRPAVDSSIPGVPRATERFFEDARSIPSHRLRRGRGRR